MLKFYHKHKGKKGQNVFKPHNYKSRTNEGILVCLFVDRTA